MDRGQGRGGSFVGTLLRAAVVALIYVLGARLGLALASENRNVTLVWPPTGIAVGFLLLWGYRVVPGIVAGAFVANVTNMAGVDTAAAITVGNTLAPVLAVVALRRLGFRSVLDRVRDLVSLVVIGALAMTVSATAGTAALQLTGSLGDSAFSSVWLQWWLGDSFGVVLFAPFVLLVAQVRRDDSFFTRPYESIPLVVIACGVTYSIFSSNRPLAFLISIPIVWAALRFERFATSLVVVLVTITTVTLTAAGRGQFTMQTPTEDLISLQVFNAAVVFASLVLAIVMHQRIQAQRALEQTGDAYRNVFEHASDLVLMHDRDGRLTYVNRAASAITGYSKERLLTMLISDLVVPEAVQVVRRGIERQTATDAPTITYEVEVRGTGGRYLAMEFSSTAMETYGGAMTFQVIGRDVTTRRIAEDQLREGSLEDPLTGLANAASLRERLSYSIALAARDGTRIVLAVANIDGFRRVNEEIGRDAADDILVRVAGQFVEAFREPDTVARLRGDTFAVLVPALAVGRTPEVIAEQIVASAPVPLVTELERTHTTASVGVVVYPEHARTVDELLRLATIAMEDAKQRGGGRFVVYGPGLDERTTRRLAIEDELHRAIADRDLIVHFQPQVEAATLRTLRAECLLRWEHARLGRVPPAEFVRLAVENRMINDVTRFVVAEACERYARWADAGLDVGVSVNLTGPDLTPETAVMIGAQIEAAGLPNAALTVEVTEQDVRRAASHSALDRLVSLGARLSVDRFGADASSMSHLSHLSVAELKIDRGITVSVATDPSSRAAAQAIVDLAHSFGAIAVAVGVETRDAWIVLNEMGCDVMQGNMISPPLAHNEFESWLQTPAWSGRVR